MMRFLILKPFQAMAFSCCCLWKSPSIQYSIFLKTISMKMVCGQAQPQNILPKTAVKRMMKTTNVIMASAKMKKSCGPKICPNRMNFRFSTLSMIMGSPFILIHGKLKNTIR